MTADVALRLALPSDADAVLRLQFSLDAESEFMLAAPGERSADPTPVRERLRAIADGTDPSYLVVAASGSELAGYLDVTVLPYRRARRTGYVVMGVRTAFQGRGLGRALLDTAAAHGEPHGVRRLELTVMAHNRAALGLYLSCGFQVEGLRRAALDLDGAAVDEYYLGRLLADG